MHDDGGTRGVALTWLGHGSVFVRSATTRLVVDPLLRDRVMFLRRGEPLDTRELLDPDAVLVTHAHHDHLDLASIRRFPPAAPKIAPAGAERVLRRRVRGPVRRVTAGDHLTIGDIDIDVVPAAHSGGRLRAQEGDEAVGYVFEVAGTRIYVAGDTSRYDEMAKIGPVDVAVLPIGGWWRTLGPGHMDTADAVEVAHVVGARVLVPIHWGTFHPRYLGRTMRATWADTELVLREYTHRRAPELELRLLRPGETTTFEFEQLAEARA